MLLRSLRKLVPSRPPPAHRVPDGQRVYAVGDIHGRLDLLEGMLAMIERDSAAREPADVMVIFLGDLVDRGPDSRAVVERLIAFSKGPVSTRFLMGNHEEVFLRTLNGDPRALRFLLRIGGRETILSYGVGAEALRAMDFEELLAALQEKVPAEHVAFLSAFEESIEVGDYLFVHAGIRPGIAPEQQSSSDLRWIRDDFLRHRESFGKLVVHGHSITDDVDLRSNRIGIDTGAFATGRLTAIGLEKDERWFLST
jgi:serine/threonine protein phosphatase 1